MDVSVVGLRVLREIAEQGSFTAAAATLGYTQSAVSRQVAALEHEAGAALFDRRPNGARLTAAGATLLRRARVVLDELEAARRDLDGEPVAATEVRLGAFVSAGAALLPRLVPSLHRTRPDIRLTTREGTSPALARSVRAGTLDLALVTARPPYRAPDGELPRLVTDIVADGELLIAAAAHGRFAGRASVRAAELADADWIGSPSTGAEPLLGVWPGLPGRPRVAHSARDWLTKLALVAADCGLTTVSDRQRAVLPDGVITLRVEDLPPERRRLLLVRAPGPVAEAVRSVASAVRDAAG